MRITLSLAVLALAICGGCAQQFGDRLKVRPSRQSANQNNGYFYPEPSPSFTLPPTRPPTTPPTTRPPPPPVQATELEYLPPPPPQPTYVQCALSQQCLTAQACSSRGSTSSNNGNCQVGGQVGVCCNPAPTTPAPTTIPPRTTTQPAPSYIQCYLPQQCLTAQACSGRGSTSSNNGNCLVNGQAGVCCNPVPTTPAPTTIPPRTTTQPAPSYVQCYLPQQCLTAQACSSRGSTSSNNGNCLVNGQAGVCCNPAPTTPAPTTIPPRTTTQPAPSYIQCYLPQQCLTAQACNSRGSTSSNNGNCLVNGQAGVCCNPAPTTPAPTTRPPPPPVTTRPTAPPAAYLPPVTTTQSYKYPEPEEPLQFPDSNKENPFIAITVTPPRPTTTRPQVQPVLTPQEEEILFWDFRESIPGDPETDYPILDKIPQTAFSCKGKIDGYYADEETRCQVFHVCANVPDAEPIKNSFLCPNGTIFNQESFVCQWWPDANCASSSQFFQLNSNIGVVPAGSSSQGTQIKSSASGASAGISSSAGFGQLPSLSATAAVSVSSNPQY